MSTYVTSHNIHIEDSWEINHKQFKSVLLRLKTDDCLVFKRWMWSLRSEWACHNVLYKLGLWRSHTKDVDLNYPIKWYVEVLYVIFGTIIHPFA
jgi:hypothetical protein